MMADRLLQLDDVRHTNTPEAIATLFRRLGYTGVEDAQPIDIEDLQLSGRSMKAVEQAFLLADHKQGNDSLQVMLFQLQESEWEAPSIASNRMKAIATATGRVKP
ncbi:MAG: hypothetical protein AB4042_02680 [Leptolyngbyaceae cyanobacterium]